MMIDSWEAAEQACTDWLRQFRPDAHRTRGGADGGIDIVARGLIAQVKFEAAQVGRPALQRLAGARGRDSSLSMLFFTGAGYTATAVTYAELMGIALFKYDAVGRMSAKSSAAVAFLAQNRQDSSTPDVAGRDAPSSLSRYSQSHPLGGGPAYRWARRWAPLITVLFGILMFVGGIPIVIRLIAGTADPDAGETVGQAVASFLVGATVVFAGYRWGLSRVQRGFKRWG